eukprot:CAMPEP_0178419148 /NCGR_PEP_ID=MMETSP0689_2-20121128/25459_1 /TAXON_ID=160604 /ORGANISM="Amphidinium massartii, Strain CS-259" /LENGTH=392 /DNA_ID=CAMNT_0020040573 /DNA_START=64 /DNA_END=1238 /DNA_ORIENTATION=+
MGVAGGSMCCTAGLMATLGYVQRKQIMQAYSDEELLAEISARGIDVEHRAMKNYVQRHFHVEEKLGEGVSGTVYRVKRPNGEVCAMKEIQISKKRGMNDEASLVNEVACLRKLKHRHIVNLIEVVQSDRSMWIVMECVEGGGLYDRIVKMDHFSEMVVSRIIKQVLHAVHYMHSMGIVHRDLKLENILLVSGDEDSDIKIADFGLGYNLGFAQYDPRGSMCLKDSRDVTGDFCGTPICMAPEVAKRKARYGPQCDLWSVGCMAYELLSGHPPFVAPTADALFQLLQHHTSGPAFKDEVWKGISNDAKELLRALLQHSPLDRPSAKEALGYRWMLAAPDHHLDQIHERHQNRLAPAAGLATEQLGAFKDVPALPHTQSSHSFLRRRGTAPSLA